MIKQEQEAGRLATQSKGNTQFGCSNKGTPVQTLADYNLTKKDSYHAQQLAEHKDIIAKVIVDGHNRYDICSKHNIPLKTANELNLASRDDVKAWIIQNQFSRRNLSPYQRSVLALKLEEIYRKKGKDKQIEHGNTAPGKPKTLLQNSAEVIDTRQELATIAHVSHDTIAKVKKIEEKAPVKTGVMSTKYSHAVINKCRFTILSGKLKKDLIMQKVIAQLRETGRLKKEINHQNIMEILRDVSSVNRTANSEIVIHQ